MFFKKVFHPLALMLALYLLAGGFFATSTPLYDKPDELRHMAMVEHYWRGGPLPVQDPANIAFYEQEGSQPPLYYLSMALLAQPFDLSDFEPAISINPHSRMGRADATDNRNHILPPAADAPSSSATFARLARWLGLLCGAVVVAATWASARLLSPAVPVLAWLSTALVAFNPQFVFITTSVTNDVFVMLFATLAIWQLLRQLRATPALAGTLWLGLWCGLAILSKSSALAIGAIAFAMLTWRLLRAQPASLWPSVRVLAPGAGLMLAISGWWYVRNLQLYGDFTGTRMMAAIAGPRVPPLAGIWSLIDEWEGFHQSFWGLFGMVNLPMHRSIYTVLMGVLALAGLGLLLLAAKRLRQRQVSVDYAGFTSMLVVSMAALLYWTSITPASQGRLLFHIITPIALLLARGLLRLGDGLPTRIPIAASMLLCAGLAVLTQLAPWLYVRPAYALPVRFAANAMPTLTQTTDIVFNDEIRWLGYSIAPGAAHLQAGDPLRVTLYWQALKPMTTNHSLFVKLFDRDNTQVAALDATPGGGVYQTSRWQPGEVIADPYTLVIDQARSLPTALKMDVGFYTFATRQTLPTLPLNRPLFDVAAIHTTQPVPAATANLLFWDGTPAARVAIASGPTRNPDGSVTIALQWTAVRSFDDVALTVFAQLLDANGNIVRQADGPPLQGGFDTRWWQPGDAFLETRNFATLPAGDYALALGLYDPVSGQRLPALQSGAQTSDNALRFVISVPR